jgi:hypothetical protein
VKVRFHLGRPEFHFMLTITIAVTVSSPRAAFLRTGTSDLPPLCIPKAWALHTLGLGLSHGKGLTLVSSPKKWEEG